MSHTIKLWVFPACDFDDWSLLVGNSSEVPSYAKYMATLAANQAELEGAGHTVIRVGMRVASMSVALEQEQLANTHENRAKMIAREPPMVYRREWMFNFGVCRDEGGTIPEITMDALLEHIIDFAVEHGFLVGGGYRLGEDETE